MHIARLKLAALALVGGVSLAGCAYDMYGDPYGYGGYGGYGYGYPSGGLSVGIGYGGYGYGYPYRGFGYGGYDSLGWFGGFFFSGTGLFLVGRYRNCHGGGGGQRGLWGDPRVTWRDR